MAAKKPSIGRQKIKIAKIQVKNHLQVTFSKRRAGLMKKASELCTLCGVEIAIIVFSPAGKVFPFGHPGVETIIDRFVTGNPPPNSGALRLVEAQRKASIRELNLQLTQLLNELEVEKKRSDAFDIMRKASQKQFLWEAPIGELGFQELVQLSDSMEELKKDVVRQANKLMTEATISSSIFTLNVGAGLYDHYESKPNRDVVDSAGSQIHRFGYVYDHGGY